MESPIMDAPRSVNTLSPEGELRALQNIQRIHTALTALGMAMVKFDRTIKSFVLHVLSGETVPIDQIPAALAQLKIAGPLRAPESGGAPTDAVNKTIMIARCKEWLREKMAQGKLPKKSAVQEEAIACFGPALKPYYFDLAWRPLNPLPRGRPRNKK
jgi:hypothetical protein